MKPLKYYRVKAEVKSIRYYIVEANSKDDAMDKAEAFDCIESDRSDEDEHVFDAEILKDQVLIKFYKAQRKKCGKGIAK